MSLGNNVLIRPLIIQPDKYEDIDFEGSFFEVIESNTVAGPLVQFDRGAPFEVPQGRGHIASEKVFIDGKPRVMETYFQSVRVKNTTSEPMILKVGLSVGKPYSTRSVISGAVQIDQSAPKVITPEPLEIAADAITILAADARLKERIIQNNSNFPVWWGDANVNPATGRGFRINPDGGYVTIPVWSTVCLMADGGTATLSINNIYKEA